jgi:hypothetical protein
VEGFIKNTFSAMIEVVRKIAIRHGIINGTVFEK